MDFTFSKVVEHLPRKAKRSTRLKKKLHIEQFKRILFTFTISIPLFELSEDIERKCLDIMYEHDSGCFVFGNKNKNFSIIAGDFISSEKDEEVIKDRITRLVDDLSKHVAEFSQIKTVHVDYGDANYGEW